MPQPLDAPTYVQLARIFAHTGATSFGGWSTTALLLEKELVEKRRILTEEQLKAATAYAQVLPGATQVAIVANVGHQIRGLSGATVATISYLMPAVTLITVFAYIYFGQLDTVDIGQHIGGLTAALGGVILANAYRIGGKHVIHPALWLVVLAACVANIFLYVPALTLILASGLLGIVYKTVMDRAKKK